MAVGFGADGLLPQGDLWAAGEEGWALFGHEVPLDVAQDLLVDSFMESMTRAVLFKDLRLVIEALAERLDCFRVLLSGELVVQAEDPTDMLVVVIVPGEAFDALSGSDKWLVSRILPPEQLLGDEPLKLNYELVRTYPAHHHRHDLGAAEERVARLMASSPIDDTPAGYLEIDFCEGGWPNGTSIGSAATTAAHSPS